MTLHRALVVAGVLVATLGAARAAEVEDRAARVSDVENRYRSLADERRNLARIYGEQAASIAALKAQPSSWSRDRKLQSLLAESKEMAALLDRKDAELAARASLLFAEQRALLAAIDREIALAPEAARAEELARRRPELAQVLAAHDRPLRLPDDRISPSDDAADLDYKAAALAQGERSLRSEELRLIARAGYFRKQAKLTRSRSRADEADVFHDDQPRRGAAPTARGAEKENPGDATATTPTPGSSAPPPLGGTPTGPTPATPQTSFDSRGVDLAADPSVILVDVVAAGTLDELRRAERSGDPDSMARAAERAGNEVKLRAERLRARRLEMEQRARDLRGERP